MDFKKWIEEAIAIAKLDEAAIARVAADDEATVPAFVFLVIGGLASAIGSLNPLALPFVVFVPIFVAIQAGIYLLIAKMLGGTGEYLPQLRPLGVGSAINWISVIPILGPMLAMITNVWFMVIAVMTIKVVHNLPIGKAIAVVLIPLVACCLCIGVAVAIAISAGVSAGMLDALKNAG